MFYGQIHYQETVGDSKLTIQEIGCFVTADSNLLEKVGVQEAPDALNTFFTNNHVYTYDATDHANDDLYWNSITRFCPQLVVSQTGTEGWPTSDLSIVEFRYKSHTGAMVAHFCAVNHAADHSIIDSYDGQVKTPAQYEAVYGQPIAWATYVYHTPETTPLETPPAVHVSAPTAAAPAPQPAPVAPKQIVLPKTNNGKYYGPWHVYRPEGPYTLPYAIGALDPYHYGPLTYDILGNPAKDIYLIKTQDFGDVAIYAGPDTVAQFPGSGHGEGESSPAENIPVSEVVPAPQTPAQAQEQTDKAAEPAEPRIVYTRFDQPLTFVTKPGATRVNFVSGTVVEELPEGKRLTFVGKATLPNNDTYYMNDNDFGIADEIQRTPITVGIKTVDLAPAPEKETEQPAAQDAVPEAEQPAASSASEQEPIKPARSWQGTFEPIIKGDAKDDPTAVMYATREDMEVFDFATGNDRREVKKNTPVPIVGTFIFGGRRYYLAESSFKKGTWYGFPVASLKRQKADNTPVNTGDDINQLEEEIMMELSKPKQAAIKAGATAQGFFSRFKTKVNK